MTSSIHAVQSASQAWKLLRGIVCLYKPSDYPIGTLWYHLQRNLVDGLNEMKRSLEFNSFDQDHSHAVRLNSGGYRVANAPLEEIHGIGSEMIEYNEDVHGGLESAVDYATHPLVLGKGFLKDDINVKIVNALQPRESGLCLFTINDPVSCYRIRAQKYPQTIRVEGVFGKMTDTKFEDGKILQKSTFAHLINRPQRLGSLLHSIQSAHQNEAFKYLKVSLQSQEAYEIACRGPVRPETLSDGLIYSIKCVKYNPPDFTLDVTSIGTDAEYLATLVHEIGRRLKTHAVTSSVRHLRYGYFDLSSALLQKHCYLQNVLQNICDNEDKLKSLGGDPHKPLIQRPNKYFSERGLQEPHFRKFDES